MDNTPFRELSIALPSPTQCMDTPLSLSRLAAVRGARLASSPIARLPEDVLLNVFHKCEENNTKTHLLPQAVILSHVASDWRGIVISHPSFWTSLRIIAPDVPSRQPSLSNIQRYQLWVTKMQQLLEVARGWIERSGQRPLSVKLDIDALPRGPSEFVARRWVEVDINLQAGEEDLEGRGCLDPLRAIRPDDVPLLERVHVAIIDGPTIMSLPLSEDLAGFQMGPAVRCLNIPWTMGRWSEFQARWDLLVQLRALGFEHGSDDGIFIPRKTLGPRAAVSLFRLCPNLVECYLCISEMINLDPEEDDGEQVPLGGARPLIALPQLRILGLEGLSHDILLPQSLALPRLQDLRFFNGCFDEEIISPELLKLWLRRFGGNLESLRLSLGESFKAEDVRKIIKLVPNLKTLRAMVMRSRSKLVEALTLRADVDNPESGYEPPCPNLREDRIWTFQCPQGSPFTLRSLV
ncbi:hypothetical protein NMY22_g15263 [Coprinellus aureogranulatus]|nr:hypothetical protein NMY22_g15263 [Coprinellus aureogranulatus]